MAKQVIIPADLNTEFDVGTQTADKISLKIDGTTLKKGASGAIEVDPNALPSSGGANNVFTALPTSDMGSPIVSTVDGDAREYYWDGSGYVAVPNSNIEVFTQIGLYVNVNSAGDSIESGNIALDVIAAKSPSKGDPVSAIVGFAVFVDDDSSSGIVGAISGKIYPTAMGVFAGVQYVISAGYDYTGYNFNTVEIPLNGGNTVDVTYDLRTPTEGNSNCTVFSYLMGYKY